tara:strand:- start:670 stop:1152 length:483 start_codon:yes stop_codon:yes gene_type:complete
MGMDVYGKNPKINKNVTDYPVYSKYKDDLTMHGKLSEKTKNRYYKELQQYESENPGIYFRNNVWWWRPLWDFCYNVSDQIDKKLWNSGHCNDGAGLNEKQSRLLARDLIVALGHGRDVEFSNQMKDNINKDRGNWEYHFDRDNVEGFIKFLLECGGFRIC